MLFNLCDLWMFAEDLQGDVYNISLGASVLFLFSHLKRHSENIPFTLRAQAWSLWDCDISLHLEEGKSHIHWKLQFQVPVLLNGNWGWRWNAGICSSMVNVFTEITTPLENKLCVQNRALTRAIPLQGTSRTYLWNPAANMSKSWPECYDFSVCGGASKSKHSSRLYEKNVCLNKEVFMCWFIPVCSSVRGRPSAVTLPR